MLQSHFTVPLWVEAIQHHSWVHHPAVFWRYSASGPNMVSSSPVKSGFHCCDSSRHHRFSEAGSKILYKGKRDVPDRVSDSGQSAVCSGWSNRSFVWALVAPHELHLSQNGSVGRDYATGDDFPAGDPIRKNNTINWMINHKCVKPAEFLMMIKSPDSLSDVREGGQGNVWCYDCDHFIRLLLRM